MTQKLGNHYIIDFSVDKISYNDINSVPFLKNICLKLIKLLKLNYLGELSHIFNPQGVSIIMLLSESHISIHTYPEFFKVSLDIYSCTKNEINIEIICTFLKNNFNIINIVYKNIPRIV